jgi:hypothetical protein
LGDVGIDGGIILKFILKKHVRGWTGFGIVSSIGLL